MGPVIFVILAIIVIAFVATNVVIVPQATAYVIEFLGSYQTTWENGLHLKIPFLQKIAKKVSLKEQVIDFEPQSVITKDNVSMKIDTVVYCQIRSPQLFVYGVQDPIFALENLTATTLRNIIGEMELDDTLTSRDTINSRMCTTLDEATDPWGIYVKRVELKIIIPPAEIQASMEKQMKAERERRETLLEANGHKQAVITRAEGDKQARILAAQAEQEAEIAIARGHAEARRLVAEAEAAALKVVQDAGVRESSLEIRKLSAMEKLADGTATKLIVPTDLAGAVGSLSVLGESLSYGQKPPVTVPKPPKGRAPDPCCDGKK